MNLRKELILEAIIRYFVETALPVGSKSLKNDFNISSATIRNDMVFLEKQGLIARPHISAGRIPTEVGYRFYVDNLIKPPKKKKIIKEKFEEIQKAYYKKKTIEKLYDTVAIISKMTENVAFATIPENHKTYYLGLASILKAPEFVHNVSTASEVIEILEGGFLDILNSLDIDKKIKIFIGKENMITQIQSCSMLATKYYLNNYSGVIGIIGPTRMKYAYNKAILEFAASILRE